MPWLIGGSTDPVVLIERDASGLGGHWYPAALELTRAAVRAGRSCEVLALGGMDDRARAALLAAGAQVRTSPATAPAAVLHRLARTAAWLSRAARRVGRHRRSSHQLTLLARCADEAAALHTATSRTRTRTRTRSGSGPVAVVLTASEGLPGLAGLLGGPHVRITHDVITTPDRPARLLERAARRGRGRVVVVCPTGAVRAAVARTHRGVAAVVQPFALACPAARLDEPERAVVRVESRARWGITEDDIVVALLGGWWPHKDIATFDQAVPLLAATGRPASAHRGSVHLVVAGRPLDHDVLNRWCAVLGPRLHITDRALTEPQMRAVHAAADLLVVVRRRGVGTESGLVCDAARHGVPLVVSDHDPDLTRRLAGQPWARTFAADDPADLARVLAEAITHPPLRPGPAAVDVLGLLTPAEALDAFTVLHHGLTPAPADGPR